MLPTFGPTAHLLYKDIGSFMLEILCRVVYEELINPHISRFSPSGYPTGNTYSISLVNKKIVGLMMDENKGKIISHFVGLPSRMYALKVQWGEKDNKSLLIGYVRIKCSHKQISLTVL